MRDDRTPPRAHSLVSEAFASFWHWTLVVAVVIAAGFVYLAHAIAGTRDLAAPVFAISGTLVALILPAASLSAQYLEPRLTYWTDELLKTDDALEAARARGHGEISAMERNVGSLWRGFLFTLVSLPLSAVALFRPDIYFYGISAEEILVGLSVGILIVAVFSFLPFIWEVLQLDLARETRAKLFTEVPTAPAASEPPAVETDNTD